MKFLIFKLALRNLFRNKRRSLITAASVFFAVILAIVMQSVQVGTYDVMIRNVAGFYTGYIQVHNTGYWEDQSLDNSMEWGEQDEYWLSQQTEIMAAAPRIESFVLASSDSATKGMLLVGVDPRREDQLTSLKSKLIDGTYWEQEGLLLAEGIAKQLKAGVGDTVVLLGQGFQGLSAAGKYVVQGIIQMGSPELNKRMAYLPLSQAQYLLSMDGRLTAMALAVKDADEAVFEARKLESYFDSSTYEVMDWQQMMPELVQTIEADFVSNSIMLGILYIIISFGIFGTVLMMLSERSHEFGVVTAVGMKRPLLSIILTIELIMISFAGAFAGMFGAIPAILWLHYRPIRFGGQMEEMMEKYDMEAILQAAIEPKIFMWHALVVFIIALFLSLYPWWKIHRLNTIEALRNL